MRILAFLTDRPAVRSILVHLDPSHRSPKNGGGHCSSLSIARVLYQVGPTDPAAFAGATALLLAVAAAACVIPARRASRVHPVESLRAE